MVPVASSMALGLLVGGLAAADGSLVRMTLHASSGDHDLDFGQDFDDIEGEWDVALRVGIDFLGTFDRFAGQDFVMGAGLQLNYAEQDDASLGLGPLDIATDTRLMGIGGRTYFGAIGGSQHFGYELLPYIGVALEELRWDPEGGDTFSDVDLMWDLGALLNVTTRFGDHWTVGLSGGVFYRWADFEYRNFTGEFDVTYSQFGFEYGLLAGVRF